MTRTGSCMTRWVGGCTADVPPCTACIAAAQGQHPAAGRLRTGWRDTDSGVWAWQPCAEGCCCLPACLPAFPCRTGRAPTAASCLCWWSATRWRTNGELLRLPSREPVQQAGLPAPLHAHPCLAPFSAPCASVAVPSALLGCLHASRASEQPLVCWRGRLLQGRQPGHQAGLGHAVGG